MFEKNKESLPLIAFASAKEFLGLYPSLEVPYQKAVLLPNGKAFVAVLGVGLLETSVQLSKLLTERKYGAVWQIGICGAFSHRGISIGDVVRVDVEYIGDLGAEEKDGSFLPWSEISGEEPTSYKAGSLEECPKWISQLPGVSGITVNCCSGVESTANNRQNLFNADIESMEGAACFAVCNAFGLPCYEIRGVSNYVSTRQKTLWKIPEALSSLKNVIHGAGFLCD